MLFRRRYRPTSTYSSPTPIEEAEGTRTRRLSAALLPRVRVQSYANFQNRNLNAFGITFPGVPEVIGPFSNYDFRLYADQNIVDLQSYRGLKASERAPDAGKMDYQRLRAISSSVQLQASISTPSLPRRESMLLSLG